MNSTVGIDSSLISKVVVTSSGEALPDVDTFRRYRAIVTTSASYYGAVDVANAGIIYNVGMVGGIGEGLRRWGDVPLEKSGRVKANPDYVADAGSVITRTANWSANWETMDLCALVERLAAGVAHYAAHGVLTCEQLSGGGEVRMQAVGHAQRPVAACGASVFVSVRADTDMSSATLAAIVHGTAGEGSKTFTDYVALTADGAEIIPKAEGAELAYGCVEALDYIAHNYVAAKAGDMYAYALVRGIHKVTTVAGHTDEGAYFRRVLRRDRFARPDGVIALRRSEFKGLPRPDGSLASFQTWVDGYALASAGLVATCDPLVNLDGRMYPTVYATKGGASLDVGQGNEGSEADARQHTAAIAATCHKFCHSYIAAITRLVGTPCDNQRAHILLQSCFTSLSGLDDRHLRHKSVSPWFWIEPTSVVYEDASHSPAGSEGYAQLCTPESPGDMPMFRGVDLSEPELGEGEFSSLTVDWRCARRHGFVLHSMLHPRDGLALARIVQCDTGRWAHVGGGQEDMDDRLERGATLDEYLWGRGHSEIPAPSEAVYAGRGIGMTFRHSGDRDGDPFNTVHLHVPNHRELRTGTVHVEVTRLAPLRNGVLTAVERTIRRSRKAAAAALDAARAYNEPGGRSEVGLMTISKCDRPVRTLAREIREVPETRVVTNLETRSAGDEDVRLPSVHPGPDGTGLALQGMTTTAAGARVSVSQHMASSGGPRPVHGNVPRGGAIQVSQGAAPDEQAPEGT